MLATETSPAETHRLKTSDRMLIERATRGFDLLQGKWKVHLIVAMARGIRRHGHLYSSLPGISKKVMTECLRGLERDGLVTRRIYAQVPVRKLAQQKKKKSKGILGTIFTVLLPLSTPAHRP